MSSHSIKMPFEFQLFHFNQFKEFEYEKPIEKVVRVHEVCKLYNDPQCLNKVIRDYFATLHLMLSKLNRIVRMTVMMMNL